MQLAHTRKIAGLGISLLMLHSAAHAQQAGETPAQTSERLKIMQQQLSVQEAMLDQLKRELAEQRKRLLELETAASPAVLATTRGMGGANTQTNAAAQTQNSAAQQAKAAVAGAPGGAVGKPRENNGKPPEVAPLFEQPGVLTPKGTFVIEPSVQFGYSSSNRVALVGYTVIPALLIGLVDVREIKRNTATAALTARTGVTNRLEAEIKAPYVYRSDSTVSRELFTGTAVERVFQTSGKDLGDVEVAARYQLNDGGVDKPFYVAGL
ncbi:MAG TPA: acetate kinase, partial [Burkholderiaceae bacterium]